MMQWSCLPEYVFSYIFQTLSASDFHDPDISSLIAIKLREFHDLDMPGPKNVGLWDRLRYVPFCPSHCFSL